MFHLNFFYFRGREARKSYIITFLGVSLLVFLLELGIKHWLMNWPINADYVSFLKLLTFSIRLCFLLPIMFRRIQDIGFSGYTIIAYYALLFGGFFLLLYASEEIAAHLHTAIVLLALFLIPLLLLFVLPGEKKDNRYGKVPR